MAPRSQLLLLALLAAQVSGAGGGRGGKRRLGSLTSSVGNRVIDDLDVDAIVRRIDVEALLARVDVNALLDRVEVNALLDRVDVDALLDRVDLDRLLDRVQVDRILDRADVDRLVARVDLDALLRDVDVEALVRRAGVPELIAESTGQAANSALDLARRQLVAVDVGLIRLSQRLLRREPGALPPGPPLLLTNRAGEVQDPELPRSRTEARVEVSGHYAGLASHLLAFAGDVVGSAAAFTAVAATSSWFLGVFTGAGFGTTERAGPLWAGALVTWYLLWWWGTVSITGRTPAMALVGLRVVNRDGAPIRSGRALLRSLLQPVSLALMGVGFAFVLVDRERRALHDLVAGAAMIYDWGGRPAELPAPISRWLAERSGPAPDTASPPPTA